MTRQPEGRPGSVRTRRRHRELAAFAERYLRDHYRETVHLADVAAHLGVSSCFLCRVFREVTGSTFHALQTRLRLECACELLLAGQAPDLTRLALDLGFSSHSHFTGAFTREYGESPSSIRAKSWKRYTEVIP